MALEGSVRGPPEPVPGFLVFELSITLLWSIGNLGFLGWLAVNDFPLLFWEIPVAISFAGLLGFLIYFTPARVAASRNTANRGAVFVVNLLLGWTVVGWIVALAMGLSEPATHRWRMRKGRWQLEPRPGHRGATTADAESATDEGDGGTPHGWAPPGAEALVASPRGAPVWEDRNRIRRVGMLGRLARVQVVSHARGTKGWMTQVETSAGDRLWVTPDVLERL